MSSRRCSGTRITVIGLPFVLAGATSWTIRPISAQQTKSSTQTIPVIVNSHGDDSAWLLGGWSGGKWVEQEKLGKKLPGGEKYTLYSQTKSVGSATGNKPFTYKGEPGEDQFNVKLRGVKPSGVVIGIGSSKNALIREVKELSTTQSVYVDAVRVILRDNKLPNAKPVIKRIVRVDLEGDGEPEVLIEASNGIPDPPYPYAKANAYSFIALRKIVKGKVQTTLLEGMFHRKTDSPESDNPSITNIYHLLHILDLNGDGVLEVITSWRYYEGSGYRVFTIINGIVKDVLGAGVEV